MHYIALSFPEQEGNWGLSLSCSLSLYSGGNQYAGEKNRNEEQAENMIS